MATRVRKPKVFDSKYYKKKYDSYLCKLTKDESKHLKEFLKVNNIGFTEFVRIAIYHLENLTVTKKYEIE